MSIPFVKGHGTQNDFVLVDDPEGTFELSPAGIRELCDRRAGLGADGVIRVVRTAVSGIEGASADLAGPAGPADPADPADPAAPEWFMDYWNADGSVAEMCGNGIRVFAAHLVRRAWIDLPSGGTVGIATRAGVKTVRRSGDQYAADLGPWSVVGGPSAVAAGGDAKVTFPGLPPLPGLSVDIGNPHVVVVLPDLEALAAVDLSWAPMVEPTPVGGTNVELVVPLHESGSAEGHIAMRVHERGSGETRSCGTGAVAAAVATRAWGGTGAPDAWRVDVPGGRLGVSISGTQTAGAFGELAGPAVIVADGELL